MAPRFFLAMACLGGAACTADQFVNGDAGNQCSTAGRRLCATDNECATDHCIRANFAVDPAASLGLCAN